MKEKVKETESKLYVTHDKTEDREIQNLDLTDWKPRSNIVILKGVIFKRKSGIVLANSMNEDPGDTYIFYIEEAGPQAKDLEKGKKVALCDYNAGITIHPIGKIGDDAYFWTYEHSIVMVEK